MRRRQLEPHARRIEVRVVVARLDRGDSVLLKERIGEGRSSTLAWEIAGCSGFHAACFAQHDRSNIVMVPASDYRPANSEYRERRSVIRSGPDALRAALIVNNQCKELRLSRA
jgi:hypothetical protein